MIIIIEGIDRVGKTTLANLITHNYNIPILKQERICGNTASSETINNINYGRTIGLVDFWNWNHFNDNIILDRFHWTEAVYSLVDRKNNIAMTQVASIESIMLKQKDKYFIIQVMPTDIKWSSNQHGSDLSRHQRIFDSLYDDCQLNKCRCDHLTYDYVLNKLERMMMYGKK